MTKTIQIIYTIKKKYIKKEKDMKKDNWNGSGGDGGSSGSGSGGGGGGDAAAADAIVLKFHPKHVTNKNKTKHMKISHINVNIYDKTATSQQNSD